MLRRLFVAALVFVFGIVGVGHADISGVFKDSESSKITKVNEKEFYITPFLGGSTLVGNLGVELQYKNFAVDVGDLMTITNVNSFLTAGIRYYFKPYRGSWFVGIGGGISLDETNQMPILGYTDDEKGQKIDNYLGILVGYRWKWGKAWNLNVGVGPATLKWEKIEPQVPGRTDKGDYLPMIETVIGYSF